MKYNEFFSDNPDPILNLMEGCKNHPSILAIKNYMQQTICFVLKDTAKQKVSKYIGNLDKNKSSQEDDIPVRLNKEDKDLFLLFHLY